MQKLFKFLFWLIFLAFQNNLYSSPAQSLHHADLAFHNGKYEEAYTEYKALFNSGYYSDAMLHKMSFIAEKLGRHAEAMYFKSMAYRLAPNFELGEQIMKMAEQYKLSGYQYSEVDYFFSYFNQYRDKITLLLVALVIAILIVMVQRRWRKKQLAYYPVFYLFFVGLCFLTGNLKLTNAKAIVNSDEAWAYLGPSSGADLLGKIAPGHQVPLVDTADVWAKILWKERPVWVKKHNLLTIE